MFQDTISCLKKTDSKITAFCVFVMGHIYVVKQQIKAVDLQIKVVILLIWNCLGVVRFDSLSPVIRFPVNVLRTV